MHVEQLGGRYSMRAQLLYTVSVNLTQNARGRPRLLFNTFGQAGCLAAGDVRRGPTTQVGLSTCPKECVRAASSHKQLPIPLLL